MIRKMGSFRSYVGLEEYEMKVSSIFNLKCLMD